MTSDYTMKLQSSKQYGTGTKTDTWVSVGRKPEINPHTCGQLSTTKEARIYNGEKTVSSISGAGEMDSYM